MSEKKMYTHCKMESKLETNAENKILVEAKSKEEKQEAKIRQLSEVVDFLKRKVSELEREARKSSREIRKLDAQYARLQSRLK